MDQTVYRSLLIQLKGANVGLTRLGHAWQLMLDIADKMERGPAQKKILKYLDELEEGIEYADAAVASVEAVLEDEDPLSGFIEPETPVPPASSVSPSRLPRGTFARGGQG